MGKRFCVGMPERGFFLFEIGKSKYMIRRVSI